LGTFGPAVATTFACLSIGEGLHWKPGRRCEAQVLQALRNSFSHHFIFSAAKILIEFYLEAGKIRLLRYKRGVVKSTKYDDASTRTWSTHLTQLYSVSA
jgi:hypothetical protein